MKKCSYCEGYGCPKCLGFGININWIINGYNNVNKCNINLKDYSSLPVVIQRDLSKCIKTYINLNRDEFDWLFSKEQ